MLSGTSGKGGSMGKGISRRGLLVASGAGALGSAAAGLDARAAEGGASVARAFFRKAGIPEAKGTRVVIIGGGWSGLIAAKALRRDEPAIDVVLIEKNASFFSCPLSNLWLVDKLPMEKLAHSYLDAARANRYIYLHAAVADIDRESRTVYTDKGTVGYDYLMIAPGIDYDYASVGVTDSAQEFALKSAFPAAFKPGSEHLTLRKKLASFEHGTFLLTVPDGNYRCLAAPYERAYLIADYFKRNRIQGKVILLDANVRPQFGADPLFAAVRDLYAGVLEHVQGVQITGVDVEKRRVETSTGSFTFDDAAIYPRIRGAKLLERAGLADLSSRQLEARIDPISYHVPDDDRVFIAGDARPTPLPKSGFVANTEAYHVASILAQRIKGSAAPAAPLSGSGTCYVAVGAEPIQSVAFKVNFGWAAGHATGQHEYSETTESLGKLSENLGKANIEWGRSLFAEMFT